MMRVGKITRVGVDGTNPTDLLDVVQGGQVDIRVELLTQKLYWSDSLAITINRADMDGSNVEPVVTTFRHPSAIELDAAGGFIYWVEGQEEQIRRSRLDGTGIETVIDLTQFDGSVQVPYGLALLP